MLSAALTVSWFLLFAVFFTWVLWRRRHDDDEDLPLTA